MRERSQIPDLGPDYRGYWRITDNVVDHVFDEVLTDVIINIVKNDVKTIVDIGCGDGSYTNHFNEKGFTCIGFDGSPLTPELTDYTCYIRDFSNPIDVGKYDLVLSLEVGEHIPLEYEQIFLDNLCRAAKNDIILSWAIIGQGGWGHVNCRNNNYIINQMLMRDFNLDMEKTKILRENCSLYWFTNTIMYFKK